MAGRGRKRAGSHVLRVADVKVVEEQSGRMCAKHAVNNVLQRIALTTEEACDASAGAGNNRSTYWSDDDGESRGLSHPSGEQNDLFHCRVKTRLDGRRAGTRQPRWVRRALRCVLVRSCACTARRRRIGLRKGAWLCACASGQHKTKQSTKRTTNQTAILVSTQVDSSGTGKTRSSANNRAAGQRYCWGAHEMRSHASQFK